MREGFTGRMRSGGKANKAERIRKFEAVVAEYEGSLLRYAARLVGHGDAAQDVVQETFIRLFRSWDHELTPAPILANWLYRVAHNCAVDHLRRESRRELVHQGHARERDDFLPPDRGEGFRISEAAEKAAGALEALTLRERQLVTLKVYEEKSYREISEITGLSEGNVGFILHHAMKKLATTLKTRDRSLFDRTSLDDAEPASEASRGDES
jgi:RNA polymerase sigma-70 factor (ECF subfamily)